MNITTRTLLKDILKWMTDNDYEFEDGAVIYNRIVENLGPEVKCASESTQSLIDEGVTTFLPFPDYDDTDSREAAEICAEATAAGLDLEDMLKAGRLTALGMALLVVRKFKNRNSIP